MPVKILTYQSPNQLMERKSIYEDYNDLIHITATKTLQKGITNSTSNIDRWTNQPIINYGSINEQIGGKWNTSKTKLRQFMYLSKAIKEYTIKNSKVEASIISSIVKNQMVILRTIRNLVESGFSPSDCEGFDDYKISIEERYFKEIWELTETFDLSYKNFREWFENFDDNPEGMFKEIIINVLKDFKEKHDKSSSSKRKDANISLSDENVESFINNSFVKKKMIIFHGFYFITPLQKRILKSLERNFTIVQLINYDSDFDECFKAVKTFLDFEKNGYQPVSANKSEINMYSYNFLKSLKGQKIEPTDNFEENILAFNDIQNFTNYINNSIESHYILSPRARELRRYVSNSLESQEMKFMDYPIGRFIYEIHNFHDRKYEESSNKFIEESRVTSDSVIRCFNSGFLFINGMNAKELVHSLSKLTPFFDNCRNFLSWETSLENLINLKNTFERPFNKRIHTGDLPRDLDVQMYPTRFISYMEVSLEDLLSIKEGIINIKGIYEKLFNNSNRSMTNHIRLLEKYFKEESLDFLKDSEKKFVNEILTRLNSINDSELIEVDKQDFIHGIQYYLSGGFEENIDDYGQEIQGDQDETKLNYEDISLYSLQDGDGLQFYHDELVHLAFADNKSLPVVQRLSLWPISQPLLTHFYSKNEFFLQYKIREDLSADITIYLIYLITHNSTKLCISFTKNLIHEKKLDASFYVKLMGLDEKNIDYIPLNTKYQIMQKELLIKTDSKIKLPVIDVEYDLCKKKSFMSYLIQDRPSYSNDFQLEYLYQSLVNVYLNLAQKSKVNESDVRNAIDNLFPQWTSLKKNLLFNNSKNYRNKSSNFKLDIEEMEIFDNLKKLAVIGGKDSMGENEIFANPGKQCKYCSHRLYCEESE